jgi:hypothetical protein
LCRAGDITETTSHASAAQRIESDGPRSSTQAILVRRKELTMSDENLSGWDADEQHERTIEEANARLQSYRRSHDGNVEDWNFQGLKELQPRLHVSRD